MELHPVCSVNRETRIPHLSDNAGDRLETVVKYLAFALGVVKALPKIVVIAVCLAASGAAILWDMLVANRDKI